MSIKNIYILQDTIREYRRDFYAGLFENSDFNVTLMCHENNLSEYSSQIINYQKDKLNLPYDLLFKNLSRNDFVKISKAEIIVVDANLRNLDIYILGIARFLFGFKLVFWGHWRSAHTPWAYVRMRDLLFLFLCSYRLFYYEEEVSFSKIPLRVDFVNNTVNTRQIAKYSAPVKFSYRNRSELKVIFIGRLNNKSNYKLLLELAQRLSHVKIKFYIIGEAEDMLVEPSSNITLLGPLFSEHEISKYMNASDISIYPGAAGLSVIHALCYGVPVIVHDDPRGHNPEANKVVPGFNGLVFKKNDVVSLTLTLLQLYNDRKLLKLLKMNCRTFINSNSSDIMTKRFSDVLRKL